jgi:hypothetical protein
MESFILLDGDTVMFLPAFGPAMVTVLPGRMTGSGGSPGSASDLIQGRRPCIEGDERSVMVAGCSYMAGPHTIPGIGTIRIERLAPDQIAQSTRLGGKRALLVGSLFTARFDVQAPARMFVPPGQYVPDATPFYLGQGRFVTANVTRKGS